MNFDSTSSSPTDLPIAESTQIENTAKTPLGRLKISLANRLGFNSVPNSPRETPPPPKRIAINSPTRSKLDPQVYLDTQSNGFASRVVKYHEATESKGREIANKAYRRPGDLPIVNLDKSELNLNQKQANAQKVSKINIAPPINLVSASNASARSTIFRTGKNYGDSYPIGKLGPIEGRKPIKATLPHDEPIVHTTNDYESASFRSSLEALKEISRKRIHCDEIDGDTNKKQRGDAVNDYEQNNAQTMNSSKRTRDRTSPSFCSSSSQVQKRYKNNDILSSLSSSILINTPKRSLQSADATPTKISRPELTYNKTDASENLSSDNFADNKKAIESSRVGTSNSDLPLHHPTESIKPVIKSMSDGYVPPSKPTTKTNKLTLFNKVYSADATTDQKSVIDDDEDDSISFVKPKIKTSSIFSGNKNRDQKSKLAMMLSFLRGDESKDEVDSARKPLINADEKEDTKVSSSSTSANLSTITSVTFSTATTTSLLNAPSNAIKSTITEPPKSDIKDISKPSESSATSGFTLSTTVSSPSSTAVTGIITSNEIEKPKTSNGSAIKSVSTPTVTFNLPTTQATSVGNTNVLPLNKIETTPKPATDDVFKSIGDKQNSSSWECSSCMNKNSNDIEKCACCETPKASKDGGTVKDTSKKEFGSLASSQNFSFGSPSGSTFNFGSKPDNKPSFQFGSAAANNTTATATTTATVTTTVTSNTFGSSSQTSAFTFKSTTTESAAPSQSPALGGFKFGFGSGTATTNAPTFGSTTTNAPTFGAASTNAPTFGSTTTNAPAFGSTTTNAPTFGSTTTNAPTFGSTTTNTPAFGFSSTNAVTFGSKEVPKIANSTAVPSLNANKGITENAFGKPATNGPTEASKPTFTFGQGSTIPTKFPAATTTSSNASSVFGQPQNTFNAIVSNPAATQESNTKPTFAFGINKPTASAFPTAQPTFGNPTNAAATPFSFNTSNTATTTASSAFGAPPAYGSGNNLFSTPTAAAANPTQPSNNTNIFGSTPTTQSQPAFGSSNNLFSAPTTATANPSQPTNSAFGSPASGVFSFGQTAAQPPATTASVGMFGTANTNTTPNAPFVFGQSNTIQSTTPGQPGGIFGAKPATENTALSAPAAFGSTSPAFNFTAKPAFGNPPNPETKPTPFSFNPSANATPAFGAAPAAAAATAPPQFGSTNGIGSSFSFGTANSPPEAAKAFNFGGPATAPAAAPAAFSFSAPNQNAFQFNATPQPAANIFSIGPGSGTNTAKASRPIRTAVRRMK